MSGSSSSSESESEPESESESRLLMQPSHSPSAKPHYGSARVSLPALDGSHILDPRAEAHGDPYEDPGDLSSPLSGVSGSSPGDGQPQLPALRSQTMTAKEKKRAKKEKKDKDEKDVEDLAGSFLKIINAALEIPGELESKTGQATSDASSSPPQYVFEIKSRRIKVKHDVSMTFTAWKSNKMEQKVPIVTQIYTEVCPFDQSSE
ncbi:MAG: hypothetical protein Q9175_004262 [Cornicularia normoerica]